MTVGHLRKREGPVAALAGFSAERLAHHIVERRAGKWRAGAILAQRLPEIGGEGEVSDGDAAQDAWDRALAFINSVQPEELTDADLPAETLLYRLFHEDGVRVSERQALRHDCQCQHRHRSSQNLCNTLG